MAPKTAADKKRRVSVKGSKNASTEKKAEEVPVTETEKSEPVKPVKRVTRKSQASKPEEAVVEKKEEKKEEEIKEESVSESSQQEEAKEAVSEKAKPAKKTNKKRKSEVEHVAAKSEHVEKNKNGVWAGNLSYTTSEEQIREFFKDCGKIVRMYLPKVSRHCVIQFETAQGQKKAIALSEQKLDGRSLLIKASDDYTKKNKKAKKEGDAEPVESNVVHISGLGNFNAKGEKVSAEDIKKIVEGIAKVVNVTLPKREFSEKLKG
ncbi:hypothetical protein ROZALSC1DRAFT_28389 [Rozella allomycis CSF55]|uniref:RRM domain-containing protein n=1 Tax=Rozella allomycis (strain CSF55) TaxID=988480 RepID=A0A075AUJ0_ROZAC|nr:hypothetical protein O9G_002491 [Rozella allomycis CSF55]RKP20087.1 hypothetical protein ROZALSC1DRAFT_28389 [Rozella allomycis CSF55]|eukprot:EPZ33928.1 hypothetical protein O9G_002491 [Rozella allomycis CSF55]